MRTSTCFSLGLSICLSAQKDMPNFTRDIAFVMLRSCTCALFSFYYNLSLEPCWCCFLSVSRVTIMFLHFFLFVSGGSWAFWYYSFQLKTAREAAKFGAVGGLLGAVSTAGVTWKYSRSLHGMLGFWQRLPSLQFKPRECYYNWEPKALGIGSYNVAMSTLALLIGFLSHLCPCWFILVKIWHPLLFYIYTSIPHDQNRLSTSSFIRILKMLYFDQFHWVSSLLDSINQQHT